MRYDPEQYLPPIAELAEEFTQAGQPIIHELAWAGVTVFRGVLENA